MKTKAAIFKVLTKTSLMMAALAPSTNTDSMKRQVLDKTGTPGIAGPTIKLQREKNQPFTLTGSFSAEREGNEPTHFASN
jgi:hypothetical protein